MNINRNIFCLSIGLALSGCSTFLPNESVMHSSNSVKSSILIKAAEQSSHSAYSPTLISLKKRLLAADLHGLTIYRKGETIQISGAEHLLSSHLFLKDELLLRVTTILNEHPNISVRLVNHGLNPTFAKEVFMDMSDQMDVPSKASFSNLKLQNARFDNTTKRGMKKNQRIVIILFPS